MDTGDFKMKGFCTVCKKRIHLVRIDVDLDADTTLGYSQNPEYGIAFHHAVGMAGKCNCDSFYECSNICEGTEKNPQKATKSIDQAIEEFKAYIDVEIRKHQEVIERSKEILEHLEENANRKGIFEPAKLKRRPKAQKKPSEDYQLTFFDCNKLN